MRVKMNLPQAGKVIERLGLDERGDVQRFHTQNVLKRIQKFMPMQSGALAKLTVAQTDINRPEIVTRAPQARFLYHGKLMVSDVTGSAWARKGETKHVVDKDLEYDTSKNARAGAYWDRALVAHEGDAMVNDLKNYVRYRRK